MSSSLVARCNFRRLAARAGQAAVAVELTADTVTLRPAEQSASAPGKPMRWNAKLFGLGLAMALAGCDDEGGKLGEGASAGNGVRGTYSIVNDYLRKGETSPEAPGVGINIVIFFDEAWEPIAREHSLSEPAPFMGVYVPDRVLAAPDVGSGLTDAKGDFSVARPTHDAKPRYVCLASQPKNGMVLLAGCLAVREDQGDAPLCLKSDETGLHHCAA